MVEPPFKKKRSKPGKNHSSRGSSIRWNPTCHLQSWRYMFSRSSFVVSIRMFSLRGKQTQKQTKYIKCLEKWSKHILSNIVSFDGDESHSTIHKKESPTKQIQDYYDGVDHMFGIYNISLLCLVFREKNPEKIREKQSGNHQKFHTSVAWGPFVSRTSPCAGTSLSGAA